MDIEDLLNRLRSGEDRALARALSLVENGAPEAQLLVRRARDLAGAATITGITGAPGVGKSTLADSLARTASEAGRNVAILAIDPTSPLTGGALLGDRARMDLDSRIFIRSMATRGHVGGLAGAATQALVLLEAAGKDFILLETVGTGQDEIEVAAVADVTLLVLAPGLGDEVQAAKSGILEIADVLVANKSDRDGADLLAEDLRAIAGTRPVRKTVATRGLGVPEVLADIVRIKTESGKARRVPPPSDPRIHHVGIAVRSLEEAAARFGGLLGLGRGASYELPEFGVKVLFLKVGEANLELLEPLDAGSTVASFLEKRGEGMHHVCFEVEDI
ncbi:MAG TPA: VOC family protein, partial [Vicinamibacteria bacterium]|nr:VOC family protein [Vicinamibacteria bacterium]